MRDTFFWVNDFLDRVTDFIFKQVIEKSIAAHDYEIILFKTYLVDIGLSWLRTDEGVFTNHLFKADGFFKTLIQWDFF